MCYLIAKDRGSHGCLAFKTTHGKHLVELKRKLNRAVGYKGVQLVTISRPTAYGEYAPYQFVDTEQEFLIYQNRNPGAYQRKKSHFQNHLRESWYF